MRRSICYCEPAQAAAGKRFTWKFIYQTANDLPKGSLLKFDMMSYGRDIDWEIPTANLKAASNVIYCLMPDGKVISGKEVEAQDSVAPQFEFVLPKDVEAGENVIIVMGAPQKARGNVDPVKQGNRCQLLLQRRRPFRVYVDPKGKGNYEAPDIFSFDIKGNVLKNIRILAPSVVVRNKRFDVTIRFEDEYGNLTSNAPEDTLIDLTYENLRENLNWKLFVPETGFVTLPNIYLNEVGVYRIRLTNLLTNEFFLSSPIKCFGEGADSLYWGLLHGESSRIDSGENIESCLRHMRDDCNFNFFASSSFESIEETPSDMWKLIQQNVVTFNEDDRFTALLGFHWSGAEAGEGLRQFLYLKDSKPLLRYKDIKNNLLKKIYTSINAKEVITIPGFTMGKGVGNDFSEFDPNYERVVEIYNSWGSSECTAKEGNCRPIKGSGKGSIKEWADGSIQKALKNNCRFGFVAGGADDRGVYSQLFDADQTQYSAGLTGIVAPKHTRDALFDALYRRSCYATTGARIILGFSLAGIPMGSEVSTLAKPGLTVNRHLAGFVAGADDIDCVEIIRGGKVITRIRNEERHFDFTYDDMDDLSSVIFPAKGDKPAFVYYYVRVLQKNGHIAWSSPIWIDVESSEGAENKVRKNGKS